MKVSAAHLKDLPAHCQAVSVSSNAQHFSSVTWGRWDAAREGDDFRTTYLLCDSLNFSDYDNSCQVERANYRCVTEENAFPLVRKLEVTGGHGTTGILISLISYLRNRDGIADTLNGLEDYPAIDDEMVSICESEAEDEAWEQCYKSNFRKALVESGLWPEDYENSGALYTVFREACEATNTYANHESGGNVYWNLDRITSAVTTLMVVTTIGLMSRVPPTES